MGEVKTHAACRACGGPIIGVFDLGSHWPSEFPAEKGLHARPRVPLNLIRCHSCGLIQLEHTVPPEWMFKEHYWYRSGINEAMVQALDDVVWAAIAAVPLHSKMAVLDIGANDGTLLSLYKKKLGGGCPTRVAVEPAPNLATACMEHSDILYQEFFPFGWGTNFLRKTRQDQAELEVLAKATHKNFNGFGEDSNEMYLRHHIFRCITSIACFYSNPDPSAFAAEVKRLLHPEGVWINQLAYLPRILENSAFDGICHEHVTYWSLAAMQHLLRRHALGVYDCEEVAVNEGSIRLFISHEGARPISPRVERTLQAEEALHLRDTNEPYLQLRASAEVIREGIASHIFETQAAGEEVDLLGASTKANTLLQWCGLYAPTIRRAIDRSPEKAGRFTVTGIPIVSEEEGRRDPAKLLIVGPWAFRDQLLAREKGKWPEGTRVLFPCPTMEVVEL